MMQMTFGLVSETHGSLPDVALLSRSLRAAGCPLGEAATSALREFLVSPSNAMEPTPLKEGLEQSGIYYVRHSSNSAFSSASGPLPQHHIILHPEQDPRAQLRIEVAQGPMNYVVRLSIEKCSQAA